MIKKIIGWTILACVLVFWVYAGVLACGWEMVLGILAGGFLGAVVIVAVFLIVWVD